MSSTLRKIKARPRKRNNNLQQEKIGRAVLLITGLILITTSIIIGKIDHKSESVTIIQQNSDLASNSFASEPVLVDSSLTSTIPLLNNANKNPPLRIVIPSLNIDLPVKESKIINGYWEVFPDSAGFGLGSAYPEENGNQVIFAHARIGLFEPLKNIKPGEKITVFTKNKWFTYQVSEIKEVLPSQTEVIAAISEPILTLYTCSGYSDSKRLIVISKKIPV